MSDRETINSVFISNIHLDVHEGALRALFSEVGQVLVFSILPDRRRNSAKIAYCVYGTHEMALRAVNTFQNYIINEQMIHVDLSTMEIAAQVIEILQGNSDSTAYVTNSSYPRTNEEISKALANLLAEKMFDDMKDLTISYTNNPQGVQNFSLQYPQVACATLEAQPIMGIIDSNAATASASELRSTYSAGFDKSRCCCFPSTAQNPCNPRIVPSLEDPRPASLAASASCGPFRRVPENDSKDAVIMHILRMTDDQMAIFAPEQQQCLKDFKQLYAHVQRMR